MIHLVLSEKFDHHAQISTAIFAMKMKEFDLKSSKIPSLFLKELSKTVFKIFLAQLGPELEWGGPPLPPTENSQFFLHGNRANNCHSVGPSLFLRNTAM